MVLWPDWENLFILLQSYSYIKTLLLFRDWNPDFCKFQGKWRSAGKKRGVRETQVQFWTEGRKLLSVRVIGSFEISKVRESGIPVSKFLVPVQVVQAVADFHVRNFWYVNTFERISWLCREWKLVYNKVSFKFPTVSFAACAEYFYKALEANKVNTL